MPCPVTNSVRYATAHLGQCDLHYAEAGSGPAILLIHGLAGDASAWNARLEMWSRGKQVIASATQKSGEE